jgi:hypothetical protein
VPRFFAVAFFAVVFFAARFVVAFFVDRFLAGEWRVAARFAGGIGPVSSARGLMLRFERVGRAMASMIAPKVGAQRVSAALVERVCQDRS